MVGSRLRDRAMDAAIGRQALEVFRSDPSRTSVRTSTTELHRADAALPDGATLYYSGVDPHLGPIVKYAEVHADDRA